MVEVKKTIGINKNTLKRVKTLKYDLDLQSYEAVILFLLDYYEENNK